ncbi:fungal-specific transcription factor domain-containing protein [Xylariales sp. PMI_506]|nr:fungal-specific transcription factor domain-containing protein [Xylariales sp. PMI_506]
MATAHEQWWTNFQLDNALASDQRMEKRQKQSSSSSSSGSVSGDGNTTAVTKNFVCTHSGCGKRFTRAEHMQRHALNHTAGTATCPRCSAHFKRPDLLERHLNRHRQKDQEAGGEGHGVLNTRKRCWKAPDGRVVPKRPALDLSARQESPDSQPSGHAHSERSPSHLSAGVELPISPPTSAEHSDLSLHQDIAEEQYDGARSSLDGSSWPLSGISPFDEPSNSVAQESFWVNLGLCSTGSSSTFYQTDLPYDDIFQPDTASSFNMPYTTAANYGWLFDQNTAFSMPPVKPGPGPGVGLDFFAPDQAAQLMGSPNPLPSADPSASMNMQTAGMTGMNGFDNTNAASGKVPEPMQHQHQQHQQQQTPIRTPPSGPLSTNPHKRGPRPQMLTPGSSVVSHTATESSDIERPLSKPSRLPLIDEDTRDRLLELIDSSRPSIPTGTLDAWGHPLLSLPALQEYMDLFFTKFNTAYPLIHSTTFDASQTEPLLLLSILLLGATYSTRDAHQLAVCIHDVIRPQIFAHAGFSEKPQLWVLQTILLVECFGKSRAGQKQHDMSHLFHGLLINLIRRSDCQTVQTSVHRDIPAEAMDLESRWRKWAEAEEKKRLALLCFMWDTQHAVLFCQSLCMSAFELRLAMPCSQTLWEAGDEVKWAATARLELQHETSFLAALKSLLSTTNSQRPTQLNALSRVLLLHGLMSISWDMQRRDQTVLGVVNFAGGGHWRDRLGDAYDLWKADFDAYCAEMAIRQQRQQRLAANGGSNSGSDVDWDVARREFTTFSTSYVAIYHAAHILLNSSFLDVQIYAGARHILGRPVHRRDYIRSERVIKRWGAGVAADDMPQPQQSVGHTTGGGGGGGNNNNPAGTPGREDGSPASIAMVPGRTATTNLVSPAAKAAYHAACALQAASLDLDDFDCMGFFHVPWCLYLSTLTLWAFHHTRPPTSRWGGGGGGGDYDDEDSEMVWDARQEMDELLAGMVRTKPSSAAIGGQGIGPGSGAVGPLAGVMQTRRSTGGLVWVMADVLGKVRWGVIHSGVLVLKALIPLRLISQYEAS